MNGRNSYPGAAENVVPLRRPPPTPPEPFQPVYVSQLEGYVPTPRPWIVDGIVMRKTVCLFAGPPKIGKCCGAGTPILMFDGSLRKVEDVRAGDLLMGPDSKPRTVRGLNSGIGPLFRVTPNKGDPYVVNGDHVLSLKISPARRQRLFPFPVNLSVREYLTLSVNKKHRLKGWRTGVEWPEKTVEIAPYLLGLWLGDGTAGFPEITSANPEIIQPALEAFAEGTNLRVVSRDTGHEGVARSYRLTGTKGVPNELSGALREYGIYDQKAIPGVYLTNSAAVRLQLLAGLIDTDGHLCKGTANCYEITQKREALAEQIVFLARSLGFAAYRKVTMKKSQANTDLRPYHRILIGGDVARIPVRLPHKKAREKTNKRRDGLLTGIRVEPIGEGQYFGFEVDGDHLFLLGDFTVTHNSLLLQQLLASVACGFAWLSHQVERCRTFGMFTEDPLDELARRQIEINSRFDREAGDYELDMAYEAREGKSALLIEFDRFSDRPQFTPLWGQLWNFVKEAEVGLVGIDTAAVVFGGNENFRGQVTSFMRALVQQAVIHDVGIILTAHPSKTGANSYSGSTAWLGSSRFAISLGRPNDYDPDTGPHNLRVLRGLGANYGAGLVSERLEYRDGIFEPAEPEQRRAKRAPLNHTERLDLEYRLLAGVKHVIKNGGKIPADTILTASIPHRARRSANPMINQVPLPDLIAAQDGLIDAGRLVRVSVGKRCLLRPLDGPYYADEQPWLDLTSPPGFV